jgi:hypothetical protein
MRQARSEFNSPLYRGWTGGAGSGLFVSGQQIIGGLQELSLLCRFAGVMQGAQQLQVDRVVNRRWRPASSGEQRPAPNVIQVKIIYVVAARNSAPVAVAFHRLVA